MPSKKLFIEIGIWFIAPISFIISYSFNYTGFGESAFHHLYVISLVIAITMLLKAIIFQNIKLKQTATALSAGIYAISLFCLLGYYTLVIIGLKSWGKVITEELMISYYHQGSQLCEAIGYPYLLVLTVLFLTYVALYLISYRLIRRYSANAIQVNFSPVLFNLLLISILTLALFNISDYIKSPPLDSMEPVSLTLFAGKSKAANHNIFQGRSRDTVIDYREIEMRSTYQLNADADSKNLILIVVDALRPSNMGIYGYKRNTTPYLNTLEKLGILSKVRNVHASCGESACGLASIASSRYIHQLPANPFIIQQLLKKYGYEITMILGGDHTNFYSLKDMYGDVDNYYDGSMAKSRYMNDDMLVIDKTKTLPIWNNVPTMIQFHLMSAHTLGKRLPEYSAYLPSKSYAGRAQGAPDEEYINYYDNGVLQADGIIKELLTILKNKNYLQNALVVITADHGESLGEHNLYAHANSVQEELLNVPLLLISYNQKNKTPSQKREFISQIDIAPTILHDLRMEVPKTWSGDSIDNIKTPDFSFFQLSPNYGLYDHRDGRALWKYWRNIRTDEEFAFNLTADPNENHNLILKVSMALKKEWRLQLPIANN